MYHRLWQIINIINIHICYMTAPGTELTCIRLPSLWRSSCGWCTSGWAGRRPQSPGWLTEPAGLQIPGCWRFLDYNLNKQKPNRTVVKKKQFITWDFVVCQLRRVVSPKLTMTIKRVTVINHKFYHWNYCYVTKLQYSIPSVVTEGLSPIYFHTERHIFTLRSYTVSFSLFTDTQLTFPDSCRWRTWRNFTHCCWMPAIPLVAVWTLDKDGAITQALCKYFASNVVESDSFSWKQRLSTISTCKPRQVTRSESQQPPSCQQMIH